MSLDIELATENIDNMDSNDAGAAIEANAPVALFKKRGPKGKANIRKRPATPPPANSDSDSDYTSSEDESGQHVKRRKKNAAVTVSSKDAPTVAQDLNATVFKANRDLPISSSNDATKQSNWYDDGTKDDLSAKTLLGSSKSTAKPSQADGTYKGLANQTSFIQKNPDAPKKTVGPIKAPTNIRTITVTDFAPDVCKDYKKTGFCGFGSNCREDYKHGWQLDREWDTVTKGKKSLGGTVVASAKRDKTDGDDDDDDNDDTLLQNIPFVCIICEESYKSPIITRCGHYFCEPCALKRYRKDPTCAACGAATNGVFNSGKRLNKLLDKKREREAQRRQAALEAGEEVSDQEDE
ncbi:pre-mRNA splicing factor cwc24 [Metarhizium acridum CQMa 102]|uniref:Pre-mRNA-splicing factor CWC24 n=1 Tax=Metarhizium acridum (strain CQMa 102) TaxID=655827 RepID=E9E662_METAQ|nr:pre-mRNA splicing factor cwc24 [Metarhizium acridum CQMa 102]EFY88595.1 pre-mRNA splicing factor cwc24 [Metarhizium acridum CQMa 102]